MEEVYLVHQADREVMDRQAGPPVLHPTDLEAMVDLLPLLLSATPRFHHLQLVCPLAHRVAHQQTSSRLLQVSLSTRHHRDLVVHPVSEAPQGMHERPGSQGNAWL